MLLTLECLVQSLVSSPLDLGLHLGFLLCSPLLSSNLHLVLEVGFKIAQSLAFPLTQTVGVRRSDPLLKCVQHLLVTSSSLSLSIDTCLSLGQLDFEDLLLVENEVGRAMLTLAFHATKIHASHAL